MSPTTPPPQDDPVLRDTLKRCSPATYYAACKFRASGDTAALHAVVLGVVERFADRAVRSNLHGHTATVDALRLREDLGLDSLTMMEIVMIAEEVLRITISNEELGGLRTLGAVQSFIAEKAAHAATLGAVNQSSGPAPDWDRSALELVSRSDDRAPAPLPTLIEQRPHHA